MTVPPELGPFQLVARIGAGGFGEVWRAHHVGGMPAAVKVITAPAARSTVDATDLHQEALAAASLAHPGIITVLGYGQVDSGPLLGAPWLAMELAEGGTSTPGPHPWPEVRQLLVDLLEALAHSHARGLLHGDVKASNVVLGGRTPGPKLTDFGVARRLGHPDGSSAVQPSAGTGAYMAPELWTPAPRDVGPWTDLYALGCLAWQWLTGRVPFDRKSPAALGSSHLHDPLPELRAHGPLPEGVGRWLAHLLRKDPALRCASAAEALATLRRLPSREAEDLSRLFASEGAPSMTCAPTFDPGAVDSAWLDVQDPDPDPDPRPSAVLPVLDDAEGPPWTPELMVPPAPRVVAALHLVGAGLPLFGVRQPPLVGRADLQHRLWAALHEVAFSQAPACLLITGVPGVGCTRLTRWLVQEALVQGVSMAAMASAGLGPTDGLGVMVARHLDAVGLTGDVLQTRIHQGLRHHRTPWLPGEVSALRQVVAPSESLAGELQLRDRRDRFATVLRYCEGARRGGPVVLVLDDAHRSDEPLAFAEYVLEQRTPALLLLTVDEAVVSEHEGLRARIQALTSRDAVEHLRVPPLTDQQLRQLLRHHVRLEPSVETEAVTRASGNPLYALQLIGEALAAGDLSWTDDGRHATGTLGVIPTVASVWSRRIDRWWADARPPARRAATAAAALGRRIIMSEWSAACAHLAGAAPSQVLPGMTEGLLARRERDRVSWTHPALPELLLERLAGTPALEAAHLACAAILEGATDPRSLERRARHLLDGGRPEQAIAPLGEVVQRLFDAGELGRQAQACTLYEQALERAGVPRSDPTWMELTSQIALQLIFENRLDEAEQVLEGDAPGGALPVPTAMLLEARGRLDAAVDTLLAMDAPPPRLVELLLRRGAMERAHAVAETIVQREPSSRAYAALAHVHVARSEPEAAMVHAEHAARRARATGNRANLQDALNLLGESARLAGDLQRAEACYLAALRTFEGTDRGPSRLLHLNLALVAVQRGDWDGAEGWARRMLEEHGDHLQWLEPFGQLALAAALAHRRRPGDARRLWHRWGEAALAMRSGRADTLLLVQALAEAELDPELSRELQSLLARWNP